MRNAPIPINPRINFPQLRAELARHNISHTRFAEECGFSRVTFSYFSTERKLPGQLARIKIAAAASRLDLEDVYSDLDDPLPEEEPVVSTLVVIAR